MPKPKKTTESPVNKGMEKKEIKKEIKIFPNKKIISKIWKGKTKL